MKKEYNFSKMKLARKGPVAKNAKVQTSIRLEGDVFDWFMQEAHRTGIPYQTLINSVLKQHVGHGASGIEERLKRIEKAVFKNKRTG